MAAKDLALSKSGDLYLNSGGDFEIIDSVRQAIQIKLRWFLGEWKFNEDFGTPYFQKILIKNPNIAVVEKALRDQILSVDGVTGIKSISLDEDKSERSLTVEFTASTTEGDIESEVTLSNVKLWNNE